MFLRQPIPQARRQQQVFIRVVRTVAFAHKTLWAHLVSERQKHFCVTSISRTGSRTIQVKSLAPIRSVIESRSLWKHHARCSREHAKIFGDGATPNPAEPEPNRHRRVRSQ